MCHLRAPLLEVIGEKDQDAEEHREGDRFVLDFFLRIHYKHHQKPSVDHFDVPVLVELYLRREL